MKSNSDCVEITQDEAYKIITEDKNALIIDTRTLAEYNERHIKDAICVPFKIAEEYIYKNIRNFDRQIILYCLAGYNSRVIAIKLLKNGYRNAYNLDCGIIEWNYDIVLG